MHKKNQNNKRNDYYRLMAESSRDIIITQNLRGKIVYANPVLTEITGYNLEDIRGKSTVDFIPPEYLDEVEKRNAARRAGEDSIYTYNIAIFSKNGEKIPLEVSSTPMVLEGKKFEEVLLIARDLRRRKTVEKTLLEGEKSYQNLFNSMDDAIYIQDKEGCFLNVNDGAIKLYGIPREEFIGKTPEFLSAPGKNDLDDITKKISLAFSGEAQEFEFWGKKSNGEIFPKNVRVHKGDYFGEEVVIALARDITRLKTTEAALQSQLKELNILQATAFTSAQVSEKKDLIRQITNIIGNTLYPDNFGFLLIDKDTQTLYPHPSYQGVSVEEVFTPTPLSKGITGKVASTGKSLRFGDISKSTEYEEFASSIRSELCVPIKTGEEILGVINAESLKKDFFTESDERLLRIIASQTATAIEKIHLFETEKKRRQEAETLRETALAMTASLNLAEAIERILEQLSIVLPYDSASIQILDENKLEVVGERGWENQDKATFFLDGSNPNTRVIREKCIVVLGDAQADYAPFRSPPYDHICSWMGIPLIFRNKVLGMLTVDSKKNGYFTEESKSIAETFANHAAITIQNATLFNAEKEGRLNAETLRQAAHTISSSLDLEEILNTILASIKRVVPYDSAAIMLLEGDKVKITGGIGLPNMSKQIGKTFPAKNPLLEKLITDSCPLIIVDAQKNPYFEKWAKTDYVHGWMGVPLIVRSKLIGYITLDNRKVGAYTEKEAELAQTFAHQAAIAIDNSHLFRDLKHSNQELAIAYDITLEGWGKALELRDHDTQGHTYHVTDLTMQLARKMGMSEYELTNIYRGALLHDIGKIGIPDNILHKPGPLTKEEWEIMRKHPELAYDMISSIPYLLPALDIPYCHHERWDGKGYPRQLKGEKIPIAARIFSVIDIWDALLSNRDYREAWERRTVIDYLRNEAGTRLDPKVVELFLDMVGEE